MLKRYWDFALLCVAVVLLAVFASFGAARAADVSPPLKAPAYLTYPASSGFFYGVSASGLGGSATATNASAPGGNVIGGRFGFDVGYTGPIGNTFYFIEASVSAQAINGASPALNLVSAVGFSERFAVGVPPALWGQVLAAVPGLSSVAFPTVPTVNGFSLAASQPYVFASLYQDDVSATLGAATGSSWLMSYGAGVGILNRVSNGMMLDTSIEWKHGAAGMLVGGSNVTPFQDAYLATMRLKF
jgi:hypothetical protein